MVDYPLTYAIPTGDPRWRLYLFSLADTPGVAAANNFFSVLNPAGSGQLHYALQLIVTSYAQAAATASASLVSKRITAHSGGSLVGASTIGRFLTAWPDPVSSVRTGNPSVTTDGVPLAVVPPVVSTGAGSGAGSSLATSPGVGFILTPGEGLVFGTASGDVDQIWNITYLWAELGIDSVETV